MIGCECQDSCPFFQKIRSSRVYLHSVFLQDYCQGRLARDCMRKLHQEVYGEPPSDDLAPSGVVF